MAWNPPITWAPGLVTSAQLNANVRDNTGEIWREVYYSSQTSTVNVTATSAATAQSIVGGGTATYTAVPVMVEFFAPSIDIGTTNIQLSIWYDSTDLGVVVIRTGSGRMSSYGSIRHTPTAGSHTYTGKAFVDAGTGHVYANAGGAGNDAPAYLRVMQKGTT